MAHIALPNSLNGPFHRAPRLHNRIANAWQAFRLSLREALQEVAEERQAIRREQALRHLDFAQLRDIGVDRGHC